ncbi:MAG: aspartate--tRNA ligase [Candidatus Parcubacteria bacterium]|nr:aspartate--tRNA ligase [Candidatus Parcubacteria bacterium]
MLRTNTCGELTKKQVGKSITLCGWVNSRRDHGGVIFIDLRDRYGLTQIKFDPKVSQGCWNEADKVRPEWVLQVSGKVLARPKDMVNKNLATGEIEVAITEIKVLTQSKTPPFEIDQDKMVNEDLRLKYRFLDLRHTRLQKIAADRDKLIIYVREYFHKKDFIEVQTPILANSSPEGARDYLVPSRLHPGKFYALPQAPQQFKQLLMIAGFDKYFQIAPCFRDEDPRSDRHPGEFYQIDLEMSFVEQEDVWAVVEPLMIELTEKFSDKKVVKKPFPRITYKDAMEKYGSDKPDLRFDLEIQPITNLVKGCGFSVFADVVKNKGVVHALKIEGGAKFSRKEIDDLTGIAVSRGAKGLAYIVIKEKNELQSPIVKFLGDDLANKIVKELKAKTGDIIFFGADTWKTVCSALGAVRNECGNRLGLKDPKKASWLWVIDFPMYDHSELEPGKIDFSHNPFSMPQGGLKSLEEKDPLEVLAYQYDLVCNGFEISSGAIRNHEPEIMYKAFEIAGYTKTEVDAKFGHMIRAFEYGAPPHGGAAPGIDRLLMVLWELPSIRDIYAFPKNGQAEDVMLDSPSEVSAKQLRELQIKLDLEK